MSKKRVKADTAPFARDLKRIRAGFELSVHEMAELIGYTGRHLYYAERNQRNPLPLHKCARALQEKGK